jgi:hypothetical protein
VLAAEAVAPAPDRAAAEATVPVAEAGAAGAGIAATVAVEAETGVVIVVAGAAAARANNADRTSRSHRPRDAACCRANAVSGKFIHAVIGLFPAARANCSDSSISPDSLGKSGCLNTVSLR